MQNVKEIEMILQRDKLALYLGNVVGEEARHFVSLGVKYPLEKHEFLPEKIKPTQPPLKTEEPQSSHKPLEVDKNSVDDQYAIVKDAFMKIDEQLTGLLDIDGLNRLNKFLGIDAT